MKNKNYSEAYHPCNVIVICQVTFFLPLSPHNGANKSPAHRFSHEKQLKSFTHSSEEKERLFTEPPEA